MWQNSTIFNSLIIAIGINYNCSTYTYIDIISMVFILSITVIILRNVTLLITIPLLTNIFPMFWNNSGIKICYWNGKWINILKKTIEWNTTKHIIKYLHYNHK